ncbi:MAG: indole-3-glycerol-phosphate synthase, partial [Victivallaceae bacterium]
GAAALSVLTEQNYFGGSLNNLRLVRQLVKIPLLRKDFIFDEYQLYQARVAGADAVLLIAAMLDKNAFCHLQQVAESLDLAVLAEAHTAGEVELLQECGARIIGVNARNLRNFSTSLDAVAELLPQIDDSRIAVAESAINSVTDIASLRRAGAQAFLVGEKLMRSAAPDQELRRLRE